MEVQEGSWFAFQNVQPQILSITPSLVSPKRWKKKLAALRAKQMWASRVVSSSNSKKS